MLNAFLYDFKKALTRNLNWSKFRDLPQWAFAALVISLALYIVSAIILCYWLFFISLILSIVSLIIVSRKANPRGKKSKGNSSDEVSISCAQTQWFLSKRVAVVKKMLDSKNTGLDPSKSIDLLLVECENKLNSTRPSEVFQKRTKPILAPIAIIILSLITAWLNLMLPNANIPLVESFSQHILAAMDALASSIILSRTLMVYFVFICIYATAIYFAVVLIILPEIVKIIDREFLLTAELRDVLLYIKQEGSFVEQEMGRQS